MRPYRLRLLTARVVVLCLLSIMAAVVHACVPAAGSLVQPSAIAEHARFGDLHAKRTDACDQASVAAPASRGQLWQAVLPPFDARSELLRPMSPTVRLPKPTPNDRPLGPAIPIAYLRLAL